MNRNQRHPLMNLLAVLVVSGVLIAAAVTAVLLFRTLTQPTNQVEVTGIRSDLSQEGVVITFIQPRGAAAQAGLQRGDIILSIAGNPVNQRDALRDQVILQEPGSQVIVTVLHGDELRNVTVTLAVDPPYLGVDGVGVGEIPPTNNQLPPGQPGAESTPFPNAPANPSLPSAPLPRIIHVVPGSPAELARLQPGDLITAVDDQVVRSVQNVVLYMSVKQSGDTLKFTVQRQGITVEIPVTLAPHPDGSVRAFLGIQLPPVEQ